MKECLPGPQGPMGDAGPQGSKGDAGPQGPKGDVETRTNAHVSVLQNPKKTTVLEDAMNLRMSARK